MDLSWGRTARDQKLTVSISHLLTPLPASIKRYWSDMSKGRKKNSPLIEVNFNLFAGLEARRRGGAHALKMFRGSQQG